MKVAEEKAIELVEKFIPLANSTGPMHDKFEIIANAKQCALITVDEIASALPKIEIEPILQWHFKVRDNLTYWQRVKQAILSHT